MKAFETGEEGVAVVRCWSWRGKTGGWHRWQNGVAVVKVSEAGGGVGVMERLVM